MRWFDCFLAQRRLRRALGRRHRRRRSSGGDGRASRDAAAGLADVRLVPGRHDIRAQREGRANVRRRCAQAIEVYGTPTVQTSIAASGGWSRLVAVLTARTPAGKEIVVSAGGFPTKPGAQKVTIQLVEPGDVHPEGVTAHADARVVVDRAVELEPPLPRPPDGADRARSGRHRGPQAAGPAHAGHEVTARAAAVALAALALVGDSRRRARRGSRRHPDERPPRRNRPADGRSRRLRHGRPGREGLLRLRQREGRRERPEDRVPLLRRRVQPGADRAADAQARRAGQGLRGFQLGRNGEQPRGPRLPERPEGAAALRRRRLAVDRPELRAVSVDDGLPAELPRRGRRVRKDDREVEAEGAHRGALREHRARPRHAHGTDARDRGQGTACGRQAVVRVHGRRRHVSDRHAQGVRRGHADALRDAEVLHPRDHRGAQARLEAAGLHRLGLDRADDHGHRALQRAGADEGRALDRVRQEPERPDLGEGPRCRALPLDHAQAQPEREARPTSTTGTA